MSQNKLARIAWTVLMQARSYEARVQYGDESQSEQAHGSLGRCTDQLCQISHWTDVGLRAPALGVNLCLLDLQAGKRLSLALAPRNDIGTVTALLVRNRHRADGAAKPCRFLDGRIDLGDALVEVGDRLSLDNEASLGFGSSIGERQIYARHMLEVGAREEAEHADRVQAHQDADHRDEDQAQLGRCRVPILGQPRHCDQLPGFQRSAHGDHGPERILADATARRSSPSRSDGEEADLKPS
jgi:hypothetical protein